MALTGSDGYGLITEVRNSLVRDIDFRALVSRLLQGGDAGGVTAAALFCATELRSADRSGGCRKRDRP